MATKVQCAECRFWDKLDPGSNNGFCRYAPPVRSDSIGGWPISRSNDWCGKWERPDRGDP